MLIKAYISLKFWEILKTIEGAMYYNITNFFKINFVVAATGCIINVMDLKNFPNTIMLLKVDHF